VSSANRIDKWLWAVRLYKTRSLAATACRNGQVLVNEAKVKPAREVHPGEIVKARTGEIQRTLKVIAAPPSRVGAKLVPEFAEDLTPPSEFEKQRERTPPPQFQWSKGLGRPTKKARRLWEQFGESNES
jgi:ribosome-associated heat shock protein Hsp15